jgi:hypothetical protein
MERMKSERKLHEIMRQRTKGMEDGLRQKRKRECGKRKGNRRYRRRIGSCKLDVNMYTEGLLK